MPPDPEIRMQQDTHQDSVCVCYSLVFRVEASANPSKRFPLGTQARFFSLRVPPGKRLPSTITPKPNDCLSLYIYYLLFIATDLCGAWLVAIVSFFRCLFFAGVDNATDTVAVSTQKEILAKRSYATILPPSLSR